MKLVFKLFNILLCLQIIFSAFYPVLSLAQWDENYDWTGVTQPADTPQEPVPQEPTYSPYEPPPGSAEPVLTPAPSPVEVPALPTPTPAPVVESSPTP